MYHLPVTTVLASVVCDFFVCFVCRINKPKGHRKSSRSANNKTQEELESDEGLALLIPDIQETANLVQVCEY